MNKVPKYSVNLLDNKVSIESLYSFEIDAFELLKIYKANEFEVWAIERLEETIQMLERNNQKKLVKASWRPYSEILEIELWSRVEAGWYIMTTIYSKDRAIELIKSLGYDVPRE